MSFYTVAWGWKPRPKNSMHLGMVLAFRQANRLVVLVQLLAVVEHPAVAGWVRRGVFIGMFMGHIEHIYMYYIYVCVYYVYIYVCVYVCICYVYVMYMLCICYVYVMYMLYMYIQFISKLIWKSIVVSPSEVICFQVDFPYLWCWFTGVTPGGWGFDQQSFGKVWSIAKNEFGASYRML